MFLYVEVQLLQHATRNLYFPNIFTVLTLCCIQFLCIVCPSPALSCLRLSLHAAVSICLSNSSFTSRPPPLPLQFKMNGSLSLFLFPGTMFLPLAQHLTYPVIFVPFVLGGQYQRPGHPSVPLFVK